LNTKIHAVVDADGRPIRLALAAGQAHDGRVAEPLLQTISKGAILLADKAYDTNAIRAFAKQRQAWANIPAKNNRKGSFPFSQWVRQRPNELPRRRQIGSSKNLDQIVMSLRLRKSRFSITTPASRSRRPQATAPGASRPADLRRKGCPIGQMILGLPGVPWKLILGVLSRIPTTTARSLSRGTVCRSQHWWWPG
jgi:transposase